MLERGPGHHIIRGRASSPSGPARLFHRRSPVSTADAANGASAPAASRSGWRSAYLTRMRWADGLALIVTLIGAVAYFRRDVVRYVGEPVARRSSPMSSSSFTRMPRILPSELAASSTSWIWPRPWMVAW